MSMYTDKNEALRELDSRGGWLIYYPASSDGPAMWEYTGDDGYMRDLHLSSGSPQPWDDWALELTRIAIAA